MSLEKFADGDRVVDGRRTVGEAKAIVPFLDFRQQLCPVERLLVETAYACGQQVIEVFGKCLLEFLLRVAEHSGIFRVGSDIGQIIQLTENGDFGKFRDAGKENEMLIGIHALDDLIKALTEAAERFRVLCRLHVL